MRSLFNIANINKLPLACAVALPAVVAMPVASANEEEAWSLEEVVVTARRKQESLQDVPTAVTAMTRSDIEALHIDGFQSVGQTVPNLYIQKQAGMPAAPQMNIRGVSNGSLNFQVDSGIGLYIDGVYIGRPGAASFEMAELERVEVLRGPQGTLFGRNSTGGAINLITAEPSGEFSGKLQVGAGNFNAQNVKASLDLPEWNGLSARINLLHQEREGDVDNSAAQRSFQFPEPFGTIKTARRGGDSDTDAVFVALHYEGIEGLSVDYKFDRTDWEGTKSFRQLVNLDPADGFAGVIGAGLLNEITPPTLDFDYQDKLANPMETPSALEVQGHSLTLEYEISHEFAVKYIYGNRDYEMDTGGNQVYGAHEHTDALGIFGTPGDIFTPLFALRVEDQEQESHELQLMGSQESLDWIVGAFFYEEEGSIDSPIGLFRAYSTESLNAIDAAQGDYFVGQKSDVKNESEAYYAHLTYHMGDFDLSAGYRYTEDDREEFVYAHGIISNTGFKTSGDNQDYDASITYNISDVMNVYFKYATGFVSGGTLQGTAFDKEKMKSHEIGFKSDLLDRRLRINAAVFRMDRKDMQLEGFGATGTFMGQGKGADSEGLELEVTYLPVEDLTLNLNYGYTDVTMSGDLRSFQPEHTLYVGGQYDFPTLGGNIQPSLRVDLSWRDEATRLQCPGGSNQVPGSDSCVGTPDPALDKAAMLDATTQVNATLSFDEIRFGDQLTGKVVVWARNLLDENNKEYLFTLGGASLTTTYMQPRTYGVDFQVAF